MPPTTSLTISWLLRNAVGYALCSSAMDNPITSSSPDKCEEASPDERNVGLSMAGIESLDKTSTSWSVVDLLFRWMGLLAPIIPGNLGGITASVNGKFSSEPNAAVGEGAIAAGACPLPDISSIKPQLAVTTDINVPSARIAPRPA